MGRNTNTYLLLTLWSAAVLMLLSPDSPLHGPWSRCDSAIFFTSGKALMNGLRPYVDFADSKGPLLWLIYGIGYLLSPRSYTGVYVVSVFVYACTFYYNYKTARIFLKDERRALAVTLLMTVAYFWPWFHFEVRAEDFATLPVAISLYCMCRELYGCGSAAAQPTDGRGDCNSAAQPTDGRGDCNSAAQPTVRRGDCNSAAQPTDGRGDCNSAAQPTVRWIGLVLGGCFMALVMIKYSIAAMQGIIILVVMWHVLRERRKDVLPLTGWMAAGAAAVAAPFMLYLWMRGAVLAFFGEYFVNTVKTIGLDLEGNPMTLGRDWLIFIRDWRHPVFLLVLAFGGLLLGWRLPRYRWVPLLTAVFFFVLSTRHNLGYYYCICYIFVIWLLVWLFGLSGKPLKRQWLWTVAIGVMLWGAGQNFQKGSRLWKTCRWNNTEIENAYRQISATMDGSRKPRILCLFSLDYGYGLWHDALPAGKYWQCQTGSTPEMNREHTGLLESGSVDYIIINDEPRTFAKGIPPGKLLSHGYTRVLRIEYANLADAVVRTAVYRKNDHQETHE